MKLVVRWLSDRGPIDNQIVNRPQTTTTTPTITKIELKSYINERNKSHAIDVFICCCRRWCCRARKCIDTERLLYHTTEINEKKKLCGQDNFTQQQQQHK